MLHENGIRFHGFHTSRAAGQKDGQINRERNFWEFGRSWIYYHAHCVRVRRDYSAAKPQPNYPLISD
jgi:hypothetical protein